MMLAWCMHYALCRTSLKRTGPLHGRASLKLSVCALCCVSAIASCGTARYSSLQLGTTIHINTFNTRLSNQDWKRVQNRIEYYDRLFSSYPNGSPSQVKQLNASAGGTPQKLDPELIELLDAAQTISIQTNNAFALCIEPLVSLWGIGTVGATVPGDASIQSLLSLLDPHDLVLTEDTALLKYPKMGVDLGGIAKGYIAHKIAQELKSMQVKQALLDLGGNILSIGLKNGNDMWRVGIRNPRGSPQELLGVYEIGANTAVVTSGDYERYFEQDGVRYHHILDATTGYPSSRNLASSTVISHDAVLADALSTASFVMGSQEAAHLHEQYPGSEFIFVSIDALIWVSKPSSFTLLDERFTLRAWDEL